MKPKDKLIKTRPEIYLSIIPLYLILQLINQNVWDISLGRASKKIS
jgi:hypothetical protein